MRQSNKTMVTFNVISHSVTGEPLPMKVVAAFLRLGNKYDIELLRDDALKRLHYEYPSTLEEYDNCNRGSMIVQNSASDFIAANLAHEQSLNSVLMIALYRCCASGCKGNVGWLVDGGREDDALGDNSTTKLSTDNLLECLKAWEPMKESQVLTTFVWTDFDRAGVEVDPDCTSPKNCAAVRKDLLLGLFYPHPHLSGLMTWNTFHSNEMTGSLKMCSCCEAVAEEVHSLGRGDFWNELTSIFGL